MGSFVGLIFGLFTLRFLGDPRVVIPARLLIGVVSFLVYRACAEGAWGIPIAAAAGSATNTRGHARARGSVRLHPARWQAGSARHRAPPGRARGRLRRGRPHTHCARGG